MEIIKSNLYSSFDFHDSFYYNRMINKLYWKHLIINKRIAVNSYIKIYAQ